MKKVLLSLFLVLILCVSVCFSFVACNEQEPTATTEVTTGDPTAEPTAITDPLWANATYTSNTTLGSGAKTVLVELKAGEASVIFTLKTDKTTLAEALLEHQLVTGEEGAYGLYIETVNGISADWDTDESWWSITKNGVATSGASYTNIADGEHYVITRAIGY